MKSHTSQARLALITTASVAAMTLALATTPALAQTAPSDDQDATQVDEIVVTGFRASLANALSIKRREAGVVDAISAEDIADFPDTNLAESIQRIPGVSIDRDAGEGRSITVRGLSSDFTRTRINGIEAQATTSATDSSGGVNRGRGFDFNVFASELFNNITVRKTTSAEVEEGSLGATVDLRTSRPFDSGGAAQTVISAQYGYNDLSQEYSPRIAGLISRTWMDGRLGALVSLAYSDRDSIEEGFSSVRWGPASGDNGFQNPAALPGGSAAAGGLFHPRIPRYGRLTHGQERLGGTLSLQARPNGDRTLFTFDALYSKLDSTRSEQFLQAWSLSRNASQGGKPQVDIVEAIADANTGELVFMRLDDMDMRTEHRFDILETEFTQYTLALEHEFTDNLKFSGSVGRAKSEFGNPLQVAAIFDRQDTDGYSWDFRNNRNLPAINYGFDVTNPANWSVTGPTAGAPLSELRLSSSYQTNIYSTAEGSLEWILSDSVTLKGGVSLKEYVSTGTGFARRSNVAPALPAGTNIASVTGLLTNFGRNLNLPAGSATTWVTPDLEALRNVWNWDCNCDTGVAGGDFRILGLENTGTLGNWREVTETDTGFWIQADWNTMLGSMPFRGNVGVRQVKTEIEAVGYSNVGGVARATPGSNEYDDTLPSLNVALEPVENVIVRFAAAKVMARPPVTSLIPVFTLSALTAPNPSASLGNVALQPYRAKSYDVSLEWYFASESLLSFAYFYKDISTAVQRTQQTLTYSQLTALNAVAFPAGGGRDPNLSYVYSTPTNTPGGPLHGFEISYQQPFSFLPGFLSNFGTQLNYTHVESEIDYCTTASCAVFVTADLTNLSPNAWNATLYYDDGALNARVSAAYRDAYYQQIPAPNAGTRGIAANGKSETLSLDASASYAFNENLSVSIEAINLTDEPNRQNHGELNGTRDSTFVYHTTGRQVFAGIRYKF
jgi:TonB-dependent receptor